MIQAGECSAQAGPAHGQDVLDASQYKPISLDDEYDFACLGEAPSTWQATDLSVGVDHATKPLRIVSN